MYHPFSCSAREEVNVDTGRTDGKKNHIECTRRYSHTPFFALLTSCLLRRVAKWCREYGVQFKLNTGLHSGARVALLTLSLLNCSRHQRQQRRRHDCVCARASTDSLEGRLARARCVLSRSSCTVQVFQCLLLDGENAGPDAIRNAAELVVNDGDFKAFINRSVTACVCVSSRVQSQGAEVLGA